MPKTTTIRVNVKHTLRLDDLPKIEISDAVKKAMREHAAKIHARWERQFWEPQFYQNPTPPSAGVEIITDPRDKRGHDAKPARATPAGTAFRLGGNCPAS